MILNAQGRPAWQEAIQNNWYEASRWSPNRSWVWFPVQDPKKDLDRYTRQELSKNARYLYKNSPFIRGLIERMVTLVVGRGPNPVFRSELNPAWARKARNWWKKKRRNVHLGPKATFEQYGRAVARARFLDGECYTNKTLDLDTFENKVQGLEAERITGTSAQQDSAKYDDGHLLNKQGKPVAYKIREVEKLYPAEVIVHHFTPMRLGQTRGETVLAAAINTATDVNDILALEKQAVKHASSKKDVIKRKSGELNPEAMRNLRFNQQGTVFSLPTDTKAKTDYYDVRIGAGTVVLQENDEYEILQPDRPGAAWQGFIDFLANTICLSSGFPASVILPIAIGGTDIRRDMDIAQRVVETYQDDLVVEFEDILLYFLEPEMVDGDLRNPPDDMELIWHFPQRINVDRATAQQDREDVKAGLMSTDEYHGRYGDDGDAYEVQVISEAARRKKRINDAGFKDLQEFVQTMSLDPRMFQQKQGENQHDSETVPA